MPLSLHDIDIDISNAQTLDELKSKTQRVLADLLASLQSQPKILVLTDAAGSVPSGTESGTIVFQLTESTLTDPYGTVKTNMYHAPSRSLLPQS